MRTFLPSSFTGGLIMQHANMDDTNVAVKVNGVVNRFFDGGMNNKGGSLEA